MLATLVEVVVAAVTTFGLPALFVVFVLKGAIVGKPLPTSVVLPGYIFATGDTTGLYVFTPKTQQRAQLELVKSSCCFERFA